MLLLQKHDVVVVSNASNKNNCVLVIVLLFVSNNSKATRTILLEFILPPLIKNPFFIQYATNTAKITDSLSVTIYVHTRQTDTFFR